MFIVTVIENGQPKVMQASELSPLLLFLNGKGADDVRAIAGALNRDVVQVLAEAFPYAHLFTCANIIPPDKANCVVVPGAKFGQVTNPRVITVMGVKGGVGKTTVSLLLFYSLARDATVCLVDADIQAGSTIEFGVDKSEDRKVVYLTENQVLVTNQFGFPASRVPPEALGMVLGCKYVIVDSGNDPNQIAGGGKLLIVSRVGKIYLEHLRMLLDKLKERGIREYHVVLNPASDEEGRWTKLMEERVAELGVQQITSLFCLHFLPWEDRVRSVERLATSSRVAQLMARIAC